MLVLLAECVEEEYIWNLHNLMGHSNFLATVLDDEIKKSSQVLWPQVIKESLGAFCQSWKIERKKERSTQIIG